MPDLFLDLFQNRLIRKNALSSEQANRRAASAERTTFDFEGEIDRLNLIAHAMWELLQESTGLSDDQLIRKLREVDLRSGQLDGKAPALRVDCSACGRTVNARHRQCLYCGEDIVAAPFSK